MPPARPKALAHKACARPNVKRHAAAHATDESAGLWINQGLGITPYAALHIALHPVHHDTGQARTDVSRHDRADLACVASLYPIAELVAQSLREHRGAIGCREMMDGQLD